jgi:RimJ/RimL family protein N-acetyltransferase
VTFGWGDDHRRPAGPPTESASAVGVTGPDDKSASGVRLSADRQSHSVDQAHTLNLVWDLQPTLSGRIARLEPLAARHREGLFAVAGHEQIWQYWPVAPGNSRGEFDQWFDGCLQAAQTGESFHFATVAADDGALIGSTSFCTVRQEDRGIEIGWTWLTPSAWGTGANTEVKFLQLRYAFEALGVIRVEFDTDAQNARSRAALSALPAQFEGVLRNLTIRPSDGTKRSSAYFSVIDDDWPAVREQLLSRLARHLAD